MVDVIKAVHDGRVINKEGNQTETTPHGREKRRKRMAKKKHRKLLRKTRHQRRNKK